jgi:hypothetical protein
VIVLGGLGGFTIDAAVGAEGLLTEGLPGATVPNLLASTVMNWVGPPVILVIVTKGGFNVVALSVPAVMAIRTFCEAGGAFWCGFQSDGSNQASK